MHRHIMDLHDLRHLLAGGTLEIPKAPPEDDEADAPTQLIVEDIGFERIVAMMVDVAADANEGENALGRVKKIGDTMV